MDQNCHVSAFGSTLLYVLHTALHTNGVQQKCHCNKFIYLSFIYLFGGHRCIGVLMNHIYTMCGGQRTTYGIQLSNAKWVLAIELGVVRLGCKSLCLLSLLASPAYSALNHLCLWHTALRDAWRPWL